MKRFPLTLAVLLVGLGATAPAPVRADVLTAVSIDVNTNQSFLSDLNTTSGAASNTRGGSQTADILGLAYRAQDGLLYGLTIAQGGGPLANQLVSINPATGAATAIGPHGLSQFVEGGLAVDPTTGTLYGMYNVSGANRQLFTVNSTTGAATIVGNLTGMTTSAGVGNDPSGIAFNATGQMFILDDFTVGAGSKPNADLYLVDKTTGAVTFTVHVDRQLTTALGLAVDSSGTFYVANSSNNSGGFTGTLDTLFTLDPTTGVTTTVGTIGLTTILADMTFIPSAAAPVPEPGSLLLCAAATLVGFAWQRRRRQAASPVITA